MKKSKPAMFYGMAAIMVVLSLWENYLVLSGLLAGSPDKNVVAHLICATTFIKVGNLLIEGGNMSRHSDNG